MLMYSFSMEVTYHGTPFWNILYFPVSELILELEFNELPANRGYLFSMLGIRSKFNLGLKINHMLPS